MKYTHDEKGLQMAGTIEHAELVSKSTSAQAFMSEGRVRYRCQMDGIASELKFGAWPEVD